METKLKEVETDVFRQLWNNRCLGEVHLESIGRSGGILVLCDTRNCMGELVESGDQMITFKCTGITQNVTWCLSVVYANWGRNERKELWWKLAAVRSLCEGPWVVSGDFNVTRYPIEWTKMLKNFRSHG